MSYSIIKSEDGLKEALGLARGCYQRNLLKGREAISGATLRGTAKQYSGRYKASATNLLKRCGKLVKEKIGKNNKRLLIIGFSKAEKIDLVYSNDNH